MDSKVTIVVPVYNKEIYLTACIDSILAQTHSDWQLVLVDDGSTDASPEICDKYAAHDSRIEVCHIPNTGVSNARNVGIGVAHGRYITFVDADDIVEPEFIAAMLEKARISGSQVVITGYVAFFSGGKEMPPYRFAPALFAPGCYKPLLEYEHWGYTVGKLYQTKFLRDNKLEFPVGVGYGEDGIFFENVLSCLPRVCADDSALYRYCLDPMADGRAIRYDYDNELHILQSVIPAAERLVGAMKDKSVYRLLTIYPHIWRVVLAVYSTSGLTRGDRIGRLRAMDYKPSQVHFRGGSRKERFIASLVINRHFRLFDMVYRRIR